MRNLNLNLDNNPDLELETQVVKTGGCGTQRIGFMKEEKKGENKNKLTDAPTQPYQDARRNQLSQTRLLDEKEINIVEPILGKDELEALSSKFKDVKIQ